MNENNTPNVTETEFIWRRIVETVKVGGFEINGGWWLAVLIPVLILAFLFVVLMYRKDMRSVGFKWAGPLALLRLSVYAILAYVFLMPAKQTFEKVEKRSRVLVVLDISDSMRINESGQKTTGRVNHRLNQVLDYLNDDSVAFLGRLVEKNPVFVYRLGSRLDEEYQLFEREYKDTDINRIAANPDSETDKINETKFSDVTKRYIEESRTRGESVNPNEIKDTEVNKKYKQWLARQVKPVYRLPNKNGGATSVDGERWNQPAWEGFANYNFKLWLTRGISEEGQKYLTESSAWDKAAPGNADWARKWLETKEEEAIPGPILSAGEFVEGQQGGPTPLQKDLAQLRIYRERLKTRIDLVSTIADGTNVPGSVNDVLSRETGQMVQGVIVISDGRSTSDVTSPLADLKVKSKRENIPVFTVVVGGDLKPKKSVLITDVLAPEVTTPDDPFRITVEIDGPGQVGSEIPTELFVRIPGLQEEWIPIKRLLPDGNAAPNIKFEKGDPPHAQVEFVIDPEKVPEELLNKPGADPKDPKKGPVSSGKKELREGEWQVRAAVPNPNPTSKDDEKKYSDPIVVKVRKKPARVLMFCNAPSRDFQFLLTQLIRDQADVCVIVQNEGGSKGEINLLDDPNRQLVKFPDRLVKEEDDPKKTDPKEKWYNLAIYDVIIAFDPDWEQLTGEQIGKLRTWVEINAGGLMFIAGPQYTKFLGRPNEKMGPLLDILPVVPGDPDLDAAKRDPTKFWRLEFENLGVNTDYMIIDDKLAEVKSNRPDAGWDLFFTGREDYDAKATVRRGFYGCFPLREVKKASRILARFTDPNSIRLPDGTAPAWLCDMPVGRGKTIWLGSGETWRLRSFSEGYFERFWTKLIRTLGSGASKKQGTLSRLLFSKEVSSGSYFRLRAQLFDVSLQPLAKTAEPKARVRPIELSKYDARIDAIKDNTTLQQEKDKIHEKLKAEIKLTPQKSEPWEGYFAASQMLPAEKFPPGVWTVEIEVPGTSEVLKSKFVIKESRPEIDNALPDVASMYEMASELNAVLPRVTDKAVAERLSRTAMSGKEGKKLCFRFEERDNVEEEGKTVRKIDILPDVMLQEIKTQRNRAGLEDLWDKGPKAPQAVASWFGDKEQKVGWFLIIAAFLLSAEWLTRKLLKLA